MLDAAIRVFSERRYHTASISDLTAATGVTAGSLCKAFGMNLVLWTLAVLLLAGAALMRQGPSIAAAC